MEKKIRLNILSLTLIKIDSQMVNTAMYVKVKLLITSCRMTLMSQFGLLSLMVRTKSSTLLMKNRAPTIKIQ